MGRGRGAVEKPKDFGGVMKKLVNRSRYIPVMIFALVLGAAGTVCQMIGPDKLKDMTNEITKGLPAMVHGKPGHEFDRYGRGVAHRMAARRAVRRVRAAELPAKLADGQRHATHRTAAA